jgi:hypothetical protein
MHIFTVEDLEKIKERVTLDLSLRKGGYRAKINFHMGSQQYQGVRRLLLIPFLRLQ